MPPPGGAWTCIPHPQPAPPHQGCWDRGLLCDQHLTPGARPSRPWPPRGWLHPAWLCHGCSGQLLLIRSLFLRVGVPAPGDRLPGHLPLPSLDAVCAAQGHPHVPGRRVGLPVADFQNHARSGKYNLLLLISGRDVPSCHFPEVHRPVSEPVTPPRLGGQTTLGEAPITPAPSPPRCVECPTPPQGSLPSSPDLPVWLVSLPKAGCSASPFLPHAPRSPRARPLPSTRPAEEHVSVSATPASFQKLKTGVRGSPGRGRAALHGASHLCPAPSACITPSRQAGVCLL